MLERTVYAKYAMGFFLQIYNLFFQHITIEFIIMLLFLSFYEHCKHLFVYLFILIFAF